MDVIKEMELMLNLGENFSLISLERNVEKREVHIKITAKKLLETGYKLHEKHERVWEHLPMFGYRTFIHCELPVYKNEISQKKKTAKVLFAKEKSHFTLEYEETVMQMVKNYNCFAKISRELKISAKIIARIYHQNTKYLNEMPIPKAVKRLGIDETSTQKGHNYLTIFVDMDTRQIIDIQKGKSSEAIKKFAAKCEKSVEITDVSMDMSRPFQSGVGECFPQAHVTFDKWHVLKAIFKILEKLPNKNQENDNFKAALALQFPELKDIYKSETKEIFTNKLVFIANLSAEYFGENKLKSFILRNLNGITNYANSKLNNGLLEGLNSKIQLLKRLARGFNSFENFAKMIRFSFLPFSLPPKTA